MPERLEKELEFETAPELERHGYWPLRAICWLRRGHAWLLLSVHDRDYVVGYTQALAPFPCWHCTVCARRVCGHFGESVLSFLKRSESTSRGPQRWR